MSSVIAYLQDEYDQKIAALKQTIEDYIHGNPQIRVFHFFLLSDQGVDEIRRACGKASQETGKRIHVIYPVEMNGRMRMMSLPETTNQPVTRSRNEVLQEVREKLGSDQAQTNVIIDGLIAAWDTIDLLMNVVGTEVAQTYMQAGFEPLGEEGIDDDDEYE